MIQPSTILIADLSGYTQFLSSTELEHSSHILNELLELIVESDALGLTVSEIEGDAVLFYKTGEPLGCNQVVRQCLETFESFHRRLKLIERDAICQCGACQSASHLGLKFVVHSGKLKEISVANFKKASGLDMIVAHRLLKNDLEAPEYVLVTDRYLAELDESLGCDLEWHGSTQRYTDIGEVGVQYATLEGVRARIPDPPPRPTPVIPVGDDALEVEINAPLLQVYSKVIDLDKKPEWVVGLDHIDHAGTTARIDERHTCHLSGIVIDFTLLHGELGPDRAVYSELADFRDLPFTHQQTYELTSNGSNTFLRFEIKWGEDPAPPDDMKKMIMGGLLASFEQFKALCER